VRSQTKSSIGKGAMLMGTGVSSWPREGGSLFLSIDILGNTWGSCRGRAIPPGAIDTAPGKMLYFKVEKSKYSNSISLTS
jgi:hypothetical protein